jgi:hypothetical protein
MIDPKGKIVREAIVYMPTPILRSAELVDTPGFGDHMQSRKIHLENLLETSKVVWIVAVHSMLHAKEQDFLSRLLDKVISQNQLTIFPFRFQRIPLSTD